METTQLTVEWVAAERLFCSPSNPRRNEEAVPHVAASIRRFGWRQPLVARPSGEVIAGNTRLKAARSLGHDSVPVAWFEGTDLDAAAYAIADNRTHEFAAWDDQGLATLLEQLRAEDGLDGVGFDDAQIDELLAQIQADLGGELEDRGAEEPPEDPVSRLGDLWILGDHVPGEQPPGIGPVIPTAMMMRTGEPGPTTGSSGSSRPTTAPSRPPASRAGVPNRGK